MLVNERTFVRIARACVGIAALAAAALAVGACRSAPNTGAARTASLPAIESRDPWTSAQLVTPAALAAQLKQDGGAKPMLLHVGFHVLYTQGAIPGSRYVGPGQTPEGIASLEAAVIDLPKGQDLVIYCGCCPWDHCPNMRPAFAALKAQGFTNVRALAVTKNLDSDWADKGYPIAKPVN